MAARSAWAKRYSPGTSIRAATRWRRTRASGRRSRGAKTSSRSARRPFPRGRTCPGSTSRARSSSGRRGSNLLLLDEPTNDLDVDTLRSLEEALENFAGCAVVISHDRWFLDRIATHMLAFEGDSRVVWFEGNYQDYEADRHRRLGAEADTPHRIKYRKLTR